MERIPPLMLAVATAILAACGDAPPAPTPIPTHSLSPSIVVEHPTSSPSCPFPSVRPTYLPWLDEGQEVPLPFVRMEITEGDAAYSRLDWRNPLWGKAFPPYFVSLVRTTDPNLAAPGRPVPVTIEGSDLGSLYEGKEPGEASIYWVIPNVESCSTLALWLAAPDMSRRQTLKEILLIAKSLGSPN